MAIYHFSAKIISRSSGRSAVAAAAYRSASCMTDERIGAAYDYRAKQHVEHREIVVPVGTPDWMCDRERLWNAVEKVERRKDAQLAREIEAALPRELSITQQIALTREFVADQFVAKGMIADFNLHTGRSRDGGEQPHAHIMLTLRTLTGEGFGPKNRDWNQADALEGWRAEWARHVNQALDRAGRDERIDHRSLEVQRAAAEAEAKRARATGDLMRAAAEEQRAASLDREPEPKLGTIASQMEQDGERSRRGDERRSVAARNAARRALYEEGRALADRMMDVARATLMEGQRRVREASRRLERVFSDLIKDARGRNAERRGDRKGSDGASEAAESNIAQLRDMLLGRGYFEPGRHRPMPDEDRQQSHDRGR